MCEQRGQLLDYLYDEVPAAGRRDVEHHLESCDECRDELRAFRSVRQDLLAWDVPNPAPVWKAFAPAPVVPWHRQVPMWAMAAAASLMLVAGGAGGFLASAVVEGRSSHSGATVHAAVIPTDAAERSTLDPEAVVALVRQELASAGRADAGRMAQVTRTAGLDPATEARILGRMSEVVKMSQERQLGLLGDYLYKVAQEDERQRKRNGQELTQMSARVDQLQTMVSQLTQLVQQQTKGQQ